MTLFTIILPILFGYTPEETKLFNDANKYRQKHNLHKLELDDSLSNIAKTRCINLNQYHSVETSISMHNKYDEIQKKWVFVNEFEITHGHTYWYNCNAQCSLTSWIKSKSHRLALKTKNHTKIGVCIYKNYAIILFN